MAGSGWSELPGDLVKMIVGNLGKYDDKIRFSCVCKHFGQSVGDLPDLRQPQPPWLLMPYRTGSMCGLYHPFEKKVFDIDLPEAGDKVFKGTGHGWVVTLQLNGSIDVLNPLTRVRVSLPPRYEFPDVSKYDPDKIGEEYLFHADLRNPPYLASLENVRDCGRLKKVELSSSPLSDDFIAVAVFSFYRLAYCKVGDKKWHNLVEFEQELDDPRRRSYHDVTFFRGKLYALTSPIGELMICDDFSSCPRMRKCEVSPFGQPFGQLYNSDCLTNSSDLVVIRRTRDSRKMGKSWIDIKVMFSTVKFNIFKFRDTTGWIPMKSLDDDELLFMGLGSQILISSQDFIGKGNRVYFASDRLSPRCGDIEDCFDNGVFDYEDKSFKPLCYECSPRVIWPSPIWFSPSPY